MNTIDPRAGRPFDPDWRRFYAKRKSRFRPFDSTGLFIPTIQHELFRNRFEALVAQTIARSNFSILPNS